MASTTYKNRLIERLRRIEDEEILREIEASLDKAEKTYKLSDEEIEVINISEQQIKIGKTLSSDQAKSERSKWL